MVRRRSRPRARVSTCRHRKDRDSDRVGFDESLARADLDGSDGYRSNDVIIPITIDSSGIMSHRRTGSADHQVMDDEPISSDRANRTIAQSRDVDAALRAARRVDGGSGAMEATERDAMVELPRFPTAAPARRAASSRRFGRLEARALLERRRPPRRRRRAPRPSPAAPTSLRRARLRPAIPDPRHPARPGAHDQRRPDPPRARRGGRRRRTTRSSPSSTATGTILGVRVESGVSPQITGNTTKLVFAIDGAVSAGAHRRLLRQRPGAARPRGRSRTSARRRSPSARSSPTRTSPIPNSTLYGPGFVAPVGIKGHFPAGHHVHAAGRPVRDREHQPRQHHQRRSRGTAVQRPGRSTSRPGAQPGRARSRTVRSPASCPRRSRAGSRPCPAASRSTRTADGLAGRRHRRLLPGHDRATPPRRTRPSTRRCFYNPNKPDLSRGGRVHGVRRGRRQQGGRVPVQRPGQRCARRCPDFTCRSAGSTWSASRSTSSAATAWRGSSNLLTFGATLGPGNPNDGTNMPVDPTGDTLLPGQAVPTAGW